MNKNTEIIIDEQVTGKIKYSYVIYLVGFLSIIMLMHLLPAPHSPEGLPKTADTAFRIILMMVFYSLAWIIGRRFSLSYIAICALGGAMCVLQVVIAQIEGLLTDYLFLAIIIPLYLLVGVVFIGLSSFLISYPLQLLFLKTTKYFNKNSRSLDA